MAAGTLAGPASAGEAWPKGNFHISIAAWSWHRMIGEGKVKQLDMPRLVREAGAAGAAVVVATAGVDAGAAACCACAATVASANTHASTPSTSFERIDTSS